MMDHADMPRPGDLDGRGNRSQRALIDFFLWFLRVCIDQVTFMSTLFEIDMLARRLRTYVERSENLKPEAARLLEEALIRGEFERGEISRITGLPERTARRVLNDLIALGLLASDSKRGKSRGSQAEAQRWVTSCGRDGISGWFGRLSLDPR
jgi:Fic family protein